MLRRTPFKRKPKHEPVVERESKPWARPTILPIARGTYAASEGAGPVGKGEKAKPGKRTPTKEEARWMAQIVAHGCIACRLDGLPPRPTAVHHILRGGVRMGHLHTLGLCDPGHHQNGAQFGMVSRHPDKAAFEAKYGTEAELLARLRAEIGDAK
jgi:hypothetical protein